MPNVRVDPNHFEPSVLNQEELHFLLANLHKPPVAAFHGGVPAGVNRKVIEKELRRLYDLEQLKLHEGVEWAGFEAIEDSISRYLDWMERTAEIRRRGGPRHASQYDFDGNGGMFKYAVGADSDIVRTEILDDGTRREFGVRLLRSGKSILPGLDEVAPWLRRTKAEAKTDDVVKAHDPKQKHGTLTCSICGKAETYETASRKAYEAARSRIARHLKIAKTEVARHKRLYRRYFESGQGKL